MGGQLGGVAFLAFIPPPYLMGQVTFSFDRNWKNAICNKITQKDRNRKKIVS